MHTTHFANRSTNAVTPPSSIMDVFKRKKTIIDYFGPTKAKGGPVATVAPLPPPPSAPTVVFEPHTEQEKAVQYFVFTDGSQIRENRTHKSLSVSWAYVVKRRDKDTGSVVHRDCGELPKTETNQRAELLSIYNAMQWCEQKLSDPRYDINVYSDSDYSIKCLTLWVHAWKRAGWKNANRKPVKHRDIIEPCFELMERLKRTSHRVVLTHIRSHTHNTDFFANGNAEADQMASGVSKAALARQQRR